MAPPVAFLANAQAQSTTEGGILNGKNGGGGTVLFRHPKGLGRPEIALLADFAAFLGRWAFGLGGVTLGGTVITGTLTAAGLNYRSALLAFLTDPPDPNYKTLPLAQLGPIPRVVARPGLTHKSAAALNAVTADLVRLRAFQAAATSALEKAQGAAAKGDGAWESKQSAAMSKFGTRIVAILRRLPRELDSVYRTLRAAHAKGIKLVTDSTLRRDLARGAKEMSSWAKTQKRLAKKVRSRKPK
jgi:hypothetical protein